MKQALPRGTALVTGAAGGLGEAYAERLARRGRDLILVGRERRSLEAIAGRLRDADGVTIETVVADFGIPEDLATVETQLRGDERIDLLVHEADIGNEAHPAANLRELAAVVQLGCVAATRLAWAAAEGFRVQRHGTIVNIAPAGNGIPQGIGPVVAGARAYIVQFSRSLDRELWQHGVRVKARLHRAPAATSGRTL